MEKNEHILQQIVNLQSDYNDALKGALDGDLRKLIDVAPQNSLLLIQLIRNLKQFSHRLDEIEYNTRRK